MKTWFLKYFINKWLHTILYHFNSSEPAAVGGSSSFHWKKAESIETDMKIILSPN